VTDRRSSFTPLQQAILDALWTRGEATAEDVRAALPARHKLKDSSVRTMLRRLEARGFVRHRTDGKVFVYEATMRPHRVAARAVRQIIQKLCSGSVEQFLLGMIDEDVVSAEEIQRLAKKVKGTK
jgi:BlaI family penicillinase repressor